ncbi:MAG TPA: DUF692 domain-containing protein, partial [Pirellulaceae bacterium]|nr:DUF692 domain-containing protein [Pirellulaceae bacterium]
APPLAIRDMSSSSSLGFGIGLRTAHFNTLLERRAEVDWFEALSENFMMEGGRPHFVLDRIRRDFPIVLHGVSLSIGSTDPLRRDYLDRLRWLIERFEPRWISDHLCWTGVLGRNTHDLLPMPLDAASLRHVVSRIRTVQDFLERPLVLENPSSYVTFTADTMPEWEFLSRLAEGTGCRLLLDVNNVYVSSRNHGFDPQEYLRSIPAERVQQFHLAGHTDLGTHCIDTHDGRVVDAVWDLYRQAAQLTGGAATLLEWDAKIPTFDEVWAEAEKARQYLARAQFERTEEPKNQMSENSNFGSSVLGSSEFASRAFPHPAHLVAAEAE